MLLAELDLFKTTGKTVSLDPKTNIRVPDDRYGLHAIDVLDPDMVRMICEVLNLLIFMQNLPLGRL